MVEHNSEDPTIPPTHYDGSPLYYAGHNVFLEWWELIDRPNWGIVEHHWCIPNKDTHPNWAPHWAMGSIPIHPQSPVRWDITQGELGSFDNLTLTPSVLCLECGWHGYIVNGRWKPV